MFPGETDAHWHPSIERGPQATGSPGQGCDLFVQHQDEPRLDWWESGLLDRRVQADYPDVPAPLLGLASIHYAYDANGNRLSVATATNTTSYTYNLRNWLTSASHDGRTTSFSYADDGKLEQVDYPNGTRVSYSYHPTDRIEQIRHTRGAEVLAQLDYSYDANGNRTSQQELIAGVLETTSYRYDALDRLTAYTVVGPDSSQRREYGYQGYNRKTETVFDSDPNAVVAAAGPGELELVDQRLYHYDQTNWLIRIEGGSGADAYTIDYSYDANGNTLSQVDSRSPGERLDFTYSSRDRLVQVTRGPPDAQVVIGQYDYDHAGKRIRKRFGDRGDIDYAYDGAAVLEEYDATSGDLLAYYQYADRLVALAQPGGKQYTHHDALGSTIALTDAAGSLQAHYRLDPWGQVRTQSGTTDNRHIFTGKQHDPNTGLVYFGARYYDPATARFITQDSYLGEPDTPPSLHRYLYAYSNPTVYVDLEGYAASWADMVQGAEALGHTLLEGQRLMSDADQAVKDFVADTMEASEARSRALAKMWADEIAAGRSYAGFAHLAGTAAVMGTSEPYEEAKKGVKEKIFRDVQKAKAGWKGLPGEEAVTTMMDYGGATATAVVEASMPEGPVSAAAMVAGSVLGKSGGLVGKGKTALTKADDAGAATAKLAGSSSGGGGASVASQARRVAEDVKSQFFRLARSERGSIPIGRGKPLKKYSKPAIDEVPAARGGSALREQYVDAVTGLAGRVPGMRQAGMSSEQIARALHAERRLLGVRFKDLTSAEKLAEIQARNLERYGDKLGPSIEWLRNAGKSWDDIIESATRAGGKDLGF